MTTVFGLLLLAVAAGSVGLILAPLRGARQWAGSAEPADPAGEELRAAREAALRSLQELDFDYQVGKLGDFDYRRLREQQKRQAIALLKASNGHGVAREDALDREIERAVRERRRAGVGTRGRGWSGDSPAAPPRGAAGPAPLAPGRRARFVVAAALAAALVLGGTAWLYQAARSAQQDQRPIAELPAEVEHVHGLALLPGSRLALLGHHAGLLASGDGGVSWLPPSGARASGDVMAFAAHPAQPNVVYAAGHDVFLRSEDGGRTWAAATHDLPGTDVHALAADPTEPGALYAVVVDHGLFRSADGAHWVFVSAEAPSTATGLVVTAGEGRALYLATGDQGVLTSPDGRQWASASGFVNGALPTVRVVALAYDPRSGDRYEASDGSVFVGALYAGTDSGLYKSVDGGGAWRRLSLQADVAAVAVDPDDSRVLLAVDQGGRVYRSEDRGVTWRGR